MKYGLDHYRFVALFNSRKGQTFARNTIIDIVQAAHPHLQRSSIMPSDHDNVGNKGECGCRKSKQNVFDRIGRGMYKVR